MCFLLRESGSGLNMVEHVSVPVCTIRFRPPNFPLTSILWLQGSSDGSNETTTQGPKAQRCRTTCNMLLAMRVFDTKPAYHMRAGVVDVTVDQGLASTWPITATVCDKAS